MIGMTPDIGTWSPYAHMYTCIHTRTYTQDIHTLPHAKNFLKGAPICFNIWSTTKY